MVIFDLASAFEYFIKPVRRLFSWWIISSSILFLSVHSQMQIQEKIFRKNKEISPFYNKLSTNFVPNLKIYPYLKKKRGKKKDKQSCWMKLKYFREDRAGIIHRSSRNRLPRWGNKELRNAVSMRESSERLTSQAETNSGMEFGSNPHQHRQPPKASSFDPSRTLSADGQTHGFSRQIF